MIRSCDAITDTALVGLDADDRFADAEQGGKSNISAAASLDHNNSIALTLQAGDQRSQSPRTLQAAQLGADWRAAHLYRAKPSRPHPEHAIKIKSNASTRSASQGPGEEDVAPDLHLT